MSPEAEGEGESVTSFEVVTGAAVSAVVGPFMLVCNDADGPQQLGTPTPPPTRLAASAAAAEPCSQGFLAAMPVAAQTCFVGRKRPGLVALLVLQCSILF